MSRVCRPPCRSAIRRMCRWFWSARTAPSMRVCPAPIQVRRRRSLWLRHPVALAGLAFVLQPPEPLVARLAQRRFAQGRKVGRAGAETGDAQLPDNGGEMLDDSLTGFGCGAEHTG